MNLKKIFLLLIVSSPFFWWQFINHNNQIIFNYRQTPTLIINKIAYIFNNTQYSNEFLWNDTTQKSPSTIIKKNYFQSHSLLNEVTKYINNLNPRFYFQSGSGQSDSPPQVEPIAILLLPISFLGIFKLIKKFKFKFLFIALMSCFFAFITGQISFYFLFPTALLYLYTAAYEIFSWKLKYQKIFLSILIVYSLFLFFRVSLIFNI